MHSRLPRTRSLPGVRVHAVAVDGDGADPLSLGTATGVGVAGAHPAHQYPIGNAGTGATNGRDRWAGQVRPRRTWFDDDYDGEFRYDRQPVASLQAMDPDRTVYVGTASKSLAPALRLAWMVLPPALLDPVAVAKGRADRQTSVLDQERWPSSSSAPSTGTCAAHDCATASGVTPSSPHSRPCPRCGPGASPPASTPWSN